MGASYRATAHVGPFNQGDVVELDENNPEHAGLLRSGWFERVATFAPGVPLDLSGYTGPISEEYRELFAQPDVTVTLPWNLGNAAPAAPTEVEHGKDPGGAGPDVRAERRRVARGALRVRNSPVDPEPGESPVSEGHEQPSE